LQIFRNLMHKEKPFLADTCKGGASWMRVVLERNLMDVLNHDDRRKNEALQAMLSMAEMLVSRDRDPHTTQETPTTSSMAQQLSELTGVILGCESFFMALSTSVTEYLQVVATQGFTSEQKRLLLHRFEHIRLSDCYKDPSMLIHLVGGMALVLDLTLPSTQDWRPEPSRREALVIPLRLHGQLIGVIALYRADNQFSPPDMSLGQAVGKLAGLVMERERLLFEREEARSHELALQETHRRMDEFLDLASHELRTPLTTIKGNLTLARRFLVSCLDELPRENNTIRSKLQEIQTMLERADYQTEVQNRLLGELLDVTYVQKRMLKLHFSLCDLARIVDRVVEEHRSTAAMRTIHMEIPATTPVTIIADASHIGHVLSNYLSNALKFSPRESAVLVKLQTSGQHARVAVHDEGPGIPLEEQEHIWERFYRVPGIERRTGSSVGLGLGLHLCRKIIEQHNGQLGMQSNPGEGSIFWFTLPLAQQHILSRS
jgi:signal transduction histidine kinase